MSAQTQESKYINVLPPAADKFSGTVTTTPVNTERWQHAEFIVTRGVGLLGNSVLTVEACDDSSATNTIPVPFRYREISSGDVFGSLQVAASSGYATTAGSSRLDVIEVDVEALGSSAYPFIRLKAVELTDAPVLGGVLLRMSGNRYARAIDQTDLS